MNRTLQIFEHLIHRYALKHSHNLLVVQLTTDLQQGCISAAISALTASSVHINNFTVISSPQTTTTLQST